MGARNLFSCGEMQLFMSGLTERRLERLRAEVARIKHAFVGLQMELYGLVRDDFVAVLALDTLTPPCVWSVGPFLSRLPPFHDQLVNLGLEDRTKSGEGSAAVHAHTIPNTSVVMLRPAEWVQTDLFTELDSFILFLILGGGGGRSLRLLEIYFFVHEDVSYVLRQVDHLDVTGDIDDSSAGERLEFGGSI